MKTIKDSILRYLDFVARIAEEPKGSIDVAVFDANLNRPRWLLMRLHSKISDIIKLLIVRLETTSHLIPSKVTACPNSLFY